MQLGEFSKFLKTLSLKPIQVLDASIALSKYVPLNLSVTNKSLKSVNIASISELSQFIKHNILQQKGKVAFGGYLETRNIYKRSGHFKNDITEERNIHLGIDLWSEATTVVLTPLDAKVHSFKNNTNFGDYGPTIILEHNIDGVVFYTLYGHLSLKSIESLKVGQVFKQGEPIATLGDETVNGNYPPHLHFQIIKDLQGNFGDYPGVCAKTDLDFYSQNCPDPNLILKIN
ncbi:peptidase M23 [Seonamhaeicola sp. S2-3]|uniref:peptidoglycan DD-metalloendopeptidase family protein n=1 Tax=Seonamhaeicola sp. S2-3 TaxID=1936081 RepID=UPI000972B2DB|nr:peptidoglycan DD-metalloendopeptidase family protein [Seonamhaeicola sp. S2-3]APY10026.1 peptidase M23 [Seonamhaeicola sp. S2-3]